VPGLGLLGACVVSQGLVILAKDPNAVFHINDRLAVSVVMQLADDVPTACAYGASNHVVLIGTSLGACGAT
jgi:hypothetical protein